jgi:hypothetical protein
MTLSTLSQAGPRRLRLVLGTIVVVVVALVVSLVLIFVGAGRGAASHRPVVTGNASNQPAFQVFGGYAPGSPYVPYVGPCVHVSPCVAYVGQTPVNPDPNSHTDIGRPN